VKSILIVISHHDTADRLEAAQAIADESWTQLLTTDES